MTVLVIDERSLPGYLAGDREIPGPVRVIARAIDHPVIGKALARPAAKLTA